MDKRRRKLLIAIAKVGVSACIVFVVFRKIDLPHLLQTVGAANYLLLIGAALAFVISKILSSLRLNYFLKATGVDVSETYNLKLYWLGMYYNLFLPGGIGGDGYKIYHLKQRFDASAKELFASIFLDRVTGVLALFILTIGLSYGVTLPFPLGSWVWVLIPLSLVVFYFVLRKLVPSFVKAYRQTNLLSFGVQISQLVSAAMLLCALHQQTDYCAYLFLFLVSSVVAVIPFTIGGVGSREITFLVGAQWLHLNVNVAVAVSLLFFLITAVVSFGGIIYSFVTVES